MVDNTRGASAEVKLTDMPNQTKNSQRAEGRSPIDDRYYVELLAASETMRSRQESGSLPEQGDAESLLYHEARLLDGRRYREWLDLLASDCLYWVPSNPDGGDPRTESSINFDDRRRVIDRVTLIETGSLYAQIPPSRTCRIISNVEVWPEKSGEVLIRSNIVIWEHRRGRTNAFIGWQQHRAVLHDGIWRIKHKIINLINSEEPQGNTTFIL